MPRSPVTHGRRVRACISSTPTPSGSPSRSSTTPATGCAWTRCRWTVPRPPAELAARGCRSDHHAGGPRRRRGAPHLHKRCWPSATVSVDNPRYLSFIPAAPDRGGDALRPGGRRLVDLRRFVARGRRSGLRREPSAALDRRPSRSARPRRGLSSCRAERYGNLSALVAARHTAADPREGERPARWVFACSSEAHSSMQHAARVMDVDILVGPGRRRRTHDRRRSACRTGRARRGQHLRGRCQRGHDQLRRRRRHRRVPLRSAASAGSGCTSTAPTGLAALCAPSVRHRSSMASRASTRSSSTRTSGSSRRSTRAR